MKTQKASTWKIDPGHSTIGFKVKHIVIGSVAGTFSRFEGNVETRHEDFDNAEVQIAIDADSLSTQNNERDKHLKSNLFFDVLEFPKLNFNGRLQKENGNYILTGNLTIRDVTKEVKLETVFTGVGQGLFGVTRAGFELVGKINRKEFGIVWNSLLETGGMIIGEEIRLQIDVELTKE